MNRAVCMFFAAAFTTTSSVAEQLTRQEIVEKALASIQFAPDPQHGEAIPEATRVAMKTELTAYARSMDSIPEVINGLPPGTRSVILGAGRLRLISADREYCESAMKLYIMVHVAEACYARLLPQLNEVDQHKLVELLEEVASSVQRSLVAHVGQYLTEAEINALVGYMRAAATGHVKDPTRESYKRIPSREKMQAISVDFESRLAAAEPRLKDRAARMLAASGSDDEKHARELFCGMLQSDLIQPLLWNLSRETSIDAAPIAAEIKRLVPGLEQAEKRFSELSAPKTKAETDRRMAAFRKKFAEDQEALMQRMRSRSESGELSPFPADERTQPAPAASPQ